MKLIDLSLIEALVREAQQAPRGRKNWNLHPELADPVQRFLNAMEPGSYVRPHRHREPVPRWELFVVLTGRALVLRFDAEGRVLERVELAAQGDVRAVEIAAGDWHVVVAIEPATVLFEFKPGPYALGSDKDFAAWAPAEGAPGCAELLARYRSAEVGDCLAGPASA